MSEELLYRIKSRGYWHITVHPGRFVEERIPTLQRCEEIVERSRIRLRGWNFPHAGHGDIRRGLDHIEGEFTAFGSAHETWRLYQSGQFALNRALHEDWVEEDAWTPDNRKPPITPGTKLDILAALYQLSEVYEFAARLAQAHVYDLRAIVRVCLQGTKGRELFFWPSPEYTFPPQVIPAAKCDLPQLQREKEFEATALVASARELAFQHFLWLLERFNFRSPGEIPIFRRDQEDFFEGKLRPSVARY